MTSHFNYPHPKDYRDAAFHFEAKKVKVSQDKNGYILTLSIHPDEVPDAILRSWVGSRYTVAMVQIDDEEQPVLTEDQKEGKRAVQRAGILCHDREFQIFLGKHIGEPVFGEEECAAALRGLLAIGSRKELGENAHAQQQFLKLESAFDDWKKE